MHQGQGEKNKHLKDKKRLTPLEDDRERDAEAQGWEPVSWFEIYPQVEGMCQTAPEMSYHWEFRSWDRESHLLKVSPQTVPGAWKGLHTLDFLGHQCPLTFCLEKFMIKICILQIPEHAQASTKGLFFTFEVALCSFFCFPTLSSSP